MPSSMPLKSKTAYTWVVPSGKVVPGSMGLSSSVTSRAKATSSKAGTVPLRIGAGEGVGVAVGEEVGLGKGVSVGIAVGEEVGVGKGVSVGVGSGVGVSVGFRTTCVGGRVGVGLGPKSSTAPKIQPAMRASASSPPQPISRPLGNPRLGSLAVGGGMVGGGGASFSSGTMRAPHSPQKRSPAGT